jgi:hypothetical protein
MRSVPVRTLRLFSGESWIDSRIPWRAFRYWDRAYCWWGIYSSDRTRDLLIAPRAMMAARMKSSDSEAWGIRWFQSCDLKGPASWLEIS